MEPLPEESGVGISYHLVLGPLLWECPHPKALLCGGDIAKMSGVGGTGMPQFWLSVVVFFFFFPILRQKWVIGVPNNWILCIKSASVIVIQRGMKLKPEG